MDTETDRLRFRRDMALLVAAAEWPGRDFAQLDAVAVECLGLLAHLPDVTAAGVALAETIVRGWVALHGGVSSMRPPAGVTLDRLRRSRLPGVAEYFTLLRSVVIVSGFEVAA